MVEKNLYGFTRLDYNAAYFYQKIEKIRILFKQVPKIYILINLVDALAVWGRRPHAQPLTMSVIETD